jgi:hypothetical protein
MWPYLTGAAALLGLILVSGNAKASSLTDAKLDSIAPSRRRKEAGTPIFDYAISVVPLTRIVQDKKTRKQKKRTIYRQQVDGALIDGKKAASNDPSDLARLASQIVGRTISPEAFALASLAASEAGTQPNIAKVAVMHAALTKAKGKHNIVNLLTHDGHFGGQQGGYASTRQPPTFVTLELAESVLAGKVRNPTPGALYWDSPSGQRAALERRVSGYLKTPEQIADERHASRLTEISPRGIDPDTFRLWKPATPA